MANISDITFFVTHNEDTSTYNFNVNSFEALHGKLSSAFKLQQLTIQYDYGGSMRLLNSNEEYNRAIDKARSDGNFLSITISNVEDISPQVPPVPGSPLTQQVRVRKFGRSDSDSILVDLRRSFGEFKVEVAKKYGTKPKHVSFHAIDCDDDTKLRDLHLSKYTDVVLVVNSPDKPRRKTQKNFKKLDSLPFTYPQPPAEEGKQKRDNFAVYCSNPGHDHCIQPADPRPKCTECSNGVMVDETIIPGQIGEFPIELCFGGCENKKGYYAFRCQGLVYEAPFTKVTCFKSMERKINVINNSEIIEIDIPGSCTVEQLEQLLKTSTPLVGAQKFHILACKKITSSRNSSESLYQFPPNAYLLITPKDETKETAILIPHSAASSGKDEKEVEIAQRTQSFSAYFLGSSDSHKEYLRSSTLKELKNDFKRLYNGGKFKIFECKPVHQLLDTELTRLFKSQDSRFFVTKVNAYTRCDKGANINEVTVVRDYVRSVKNRSAICKVSQEPFDDVCLVTTTCGCYYSLGGLVKYVETKSMKEIICENSNPDTRERYVIRCSCGEGCFSMKALRCVPLLYQRAKDYCSNPGVPYCGIPEHKGDRFIGSQYDEGTPSYRCDSCKAEVCAVHGCKYEQGNCVCLPVSTDKIVEKIRECLKDGSVVECPKCKTATTPQQGDSTKIVCAGTRDGRICGVRFCYICGQEQQNPDAHNINWQEDVTKCAPLLSLYEKLNHAGSCLQEFHRLKTIELLRKYHHDLNCEDYERAAKKWQVALEKLKDEIADLGLHEDGVFNPEYTRL